jgi:hypothetical protein
MVAAWACSVSRNATRDTTIAMPLAAAFLRNSRRLWLTARHPRPGRPRSSCCAQAASCRNIGARRRAIKQIGAACRESCE